MNVIGFMPVWNEIEWFPYALESVYDFVDKLIITEGCYSPWNNKDGNTHSTDGTLEFIKDFIENKDKDKKITFLELEKIPTDKTKLQVSTMVENIILENSNAEDGDWLFRIDADEAYKKKDLENLRKVLETTDCTSILVPEYRFVYNFNLCMKTDHYRLFKYKTGAKFQGINFLIYPNGKTDRDMTLRLTNNVCTLYHYTYLKSPEFLYNKFTSYDRDRHFHDQDRLKWFKEVYLKFDETDPMKFYKLTEEYCYCFGFSWDCAASVRKFKGEHPEVMEKHPLRYKDVRDNESYRSFHASME